MERRRRFLTVIAILAAVIVISFCVTLIFIDNYLVSFTGAIVFIICAVLLHKRMGRAKLLGIFRTEISGRIKKVHVSSAVSSSRLGGRYSFRPKLTEKIYAYVAIETEDGEVDIVENLSAAQAQYFAVGDEVICLAGTKYPIILAGGRERESALCPICGRLFYEQEEKCISCGLDVKLV
jgi:hypothetical protein